MNEKLFAIDGVVEKPRGLEDDDLVRRHDYRLSRARVAAFALGHVLAFQRAEAVDAHLALVDERVLDGLKYC